MTLTRIQKFSLAFFMGSLLPAYFFANWRHAENLSALTLRYEQEQGLHDSTDKLITQCVENEKKDNDHFSANHRICEQGLQEHELSQRLMALLNQEKANNDLRWYRNFVLSVVLLNVLGIAIYKSSQVLPQEEV
jgi:hypothetical protein